MVGSTSLVTMGHCGALTKEERAIVGEVCVIILQVRGQDLKMFWSIAVTNTDCFFPTRNNHNLSWSKSKSDSEAICVLNTKIRPRFSCWGATQAGQVCIQLCH